MCYDGSLIDQGLRSFHREEARILLEQARLPFEEALACYHRGEREEACRQLVAASAFWTHATWKEFLEDDVVGSGVPPAYRPLSAQAG
jgi:hypothetical protein